MLNILEDAQKWMRCPGSLRMESELEGSHSDSDIVDAVDHVVSSLSRAIDCLGLPDTDSLPLSPSAKACYACKAKTTCPAVAGHVINTVADDFVDMSIPLLPQLGSAHKEVNNRTLGYLLSSVDLIDDWCQAIREKAMAELKAGRDVPGFALAELADGSIKIIAK